MKMTRPGARSPSFQAVLASAKARKRFTRSDLIADTGLSSSVVGQQVRRMLDRREIVVVDKNKGVEVMAFHSVPKLDINTDSVEAALWTAMRTQRRFEPIDLVASLAASDASIDLQKARSYCQTLLKARYLRCVRPAIHGKSEASYHLLIDSGPIAPFMKRLSVLVDPNEERVSWVPEVTV